jgi:hypothetical protein
MCSIRVAGSVPSWGLRYYPCEGLMGLNDEADEGRRRDETAAELREALESLTGIQELWIEMLSGSAPVTNERQLAALAHRVAELLEMTSVAERAHPSERPLLPFLHACPVVAGIWELDTTGPLMQLVSVMLRLPPLPLPTHEDGTRAAIDAWVELRLPVDFGVLDTVRVERRAQDGIRSLEHCVRVDASVLTDGIRTHLTDAIARSTVLTRSSSDWAYRRCGSRSRMRTSTPLGPPIVSSTSSPASSMRSHGATARAVDRTVRHPLTTTSRTASGCSPARLHN